jgi:hypothetical protein
VLLVYDQITAPSGSPAAIGSSWGASLASFLAGGGVVVVQSGGSGDQPALPFLAQKRTCGWQTSAGSASGTTFVGTDVVPGAGSDRPVVVHRIM